jgi:hypothetical protein
MGRQGPRREERKKLTPRRNRRGPVDKLHFAYPGIDASAVNASRCRPTVDGRQLLTAGCTSRIQRLAQRWLSLRVAPDDEVGVRVAVEQKFITEQPTFAESNRSRARSAWIGSLLAPANKSPRRPGRKALGSESRGQAIGRIATSKKETPRHIA